MTVIAWDGKTLAADRQSGGSYTKYEAATKIARAPDGGLFGWAGSAWLNRETADWFRNGADPAKFPAAQRDKDDSGRLLWITKDRKVMVFERGPYPMEMLNDKFAIGSGQEAAMAVMTLGYDARKAVEIASVVCLHCGNGVDSLEL